MNLFLLLIEDLKLLRLLVVVRLLLSLKLVRNVANVLLILFVHFSNFTNLLLLLLDFCVVLLYTIHQPFTSLWERQFHFVRLEFKVLLALCEVGFLISQVLGTLF